MVMLLELLCFVVFFFADDLQYKKEPAGAWRWHQSLIPVREETWNSQSGREFIWAGQLAALTQVQCRDSSMEETVTCLKKLKKIVMVMTI